MDIKCMCCYINFSNFGSEDALISIFGEDYINCKMAEKMYKSLADPHRLIYKIPLNLDRLSKCATYSFYYATNILKSKFELGEQAIKQDEYYWNKYTQFLTTLENV